GRHRSLEVAPKRLFARGADLIRCRPGDRPCRVARIGQEPREPYGAGSAAVAARDLRGAAPAGRQILEDRAGLLAAAYREEAEPAVVERFKRRERGVLRGEGSQYVQRDRPERVVRGPDRHVVVEPAL